MAEQRRIRIRTAGWYYLLVLALVVGSAVFRVSNPLLMLAGLMVAPMLLNWRIAVASVWRLSLNRRLPQRICAGDTLVVGIELTNQKRSLGSRETIVEDCIALEGGDDEYSSRVEVVFANLKPRTSTSLAYHAALTRRGSYRFGPARVHTAFPLGLAEASVELGRSDTLLVCPRLGRLTKGWLDAIESEQQGDHRSRQRRGPADGDYYGLREFRPGDSTRWIHWRTTAKTGELSVRLLERRRNHDVALVLDLWRPEPAHRADYERIELAVSLAATIVTDLCHRGDCRLLLAGAGITSSPQLLAASPLLLEELMARLTEVQGAPQDTIADVCGQFEAIVRQGTCRLVASTRPAPPEMVGEPRLTWIDVSDAPHLARMFQIG